MKPPIPIFLTCKKCGHIHAETLQNAVSGTMSQPLVCPRCQCELDIDWDWITREAEITGLIRGER